MGKSEYIVMGAWAIQRRTGKVRHLPCKRWCNYYNEDNEPIHPCDAREDEPVKETAIPPIVVTASECIRNKV